MSKIKPHFFLIFVFFSFFCPLAFAEADSPAVSLLSFMHVLTNVIFIICYATGIILFFIGLTFIRRYRQNRIETPLSKVVWTFVLAGVIFILPIVGENLNIYQEMTYASQRDSDYVN